MKIRKGFVSNSSTACFICTTKDSITTAEAKLMQLLNFYNEWMNKDLKFKDVFSVFKIDKEYIKKMKAWDNFVPKNATIIIESVDDNSIPYQMMDFITEKFDAFHHHLG